MPSSNLQIQGLLKVLSGSLKPPGFLEAVSGPGKRVALSVTDFSVLRVGEGLASFGKFLVVLGSFRVRRRGGRCFCSLLGGGEYQSDRKEPRLKRG